MNYYSEYKKNHGDKEYFAKSGPFVKIYSKYWDNICRIYEDNHEKCLTNPLLLCFPDKYKEQDIKLMIIGQETGKNGWLPSESVYRKVESISGLVDGYYEFDIGCKYNSPFFSSIRYIERNLGIDARNSIWSNLCKVDTLKYPALEEILFKDFNVLQEEIKESSPDVVLFFSGPGYDRYIMKLFDGIHCLPVDGFSKVELAQLSHPMLPKNSYRTYHPRKLFHFGKKVKDHFLDTIISMIKDAPIRASL